MSRNITLIGALVAVLVIGSMGTATAAPQNDGVPGPSVQETLGGIGDILNNLIKSVQNLVNGNADINILGVGVENIDQKRSYMSAQVSTWEDVANNQNGWWYYTNNTTSIKKVNLVVEQRGVTISKHRAEVDYDNQTVTAGSGHWKSPDVTFTLRFEDAVWINDHRTEIKNKNLTTEQALHLVRIWQRIECQSSTGACELIRNEYESHTSMMIGQADNNDS